MLLAVMGHAWHLLKRQTLKMFFMIGKLGALQYFHSSKMVEGAFFI
jgi:hypothetical protein